MKRPDMAIATATGANRAKFATRISPPTPSGCRDWMGALNGHGYGQFCIGRTTVMANRASLWWSVGAPAAIDLQAAHSCNRRICVEPAHLRWATARENSADQVDHGTRRYGPESNSGRLSEGEVRRICLAYATGEHSQQELGERFGISRSQVSRIIRGLDWGYLGVAPGSLRGRS